jgi:cyclophilin family peptidyl-prolyl cis-trans isomerase
VKSLRGSSRLAILLVLAALSPGAHAQQPKPAGAATVVVLETAKGTIEVELFVADAPKSTAHLLDLVRQGFYRGQRFHRVTPSLAQVGDPASRNVQLEGSWGSGSSGHPIGVAEISKRWTHVRGAVGLAHVGDDARSAQFADSQFYFMKAASPSLDGKYAVVGRVVKGMDVVDKIERTDVLKNVYVKGEGPK